MQNEKLAPVFIDNQPVNLQDPNPKISAILSACGLPDATGLKWVQFQPVNQGRALRPDETLDRTSEPNKPIYLTSAVDGKFAGPTVLRTGKSSVSGGQASTTSGQPAGTGGQPSITGSKPSNAGASGHSQNPQKPAYGSGGQIQVPQKPAMGDSSPIANKPGAQGASAEAGEHGAEWRRTTGRPNPANQRGKADAEDADFPEGTEGDESEDKKSES